MGQDILLTRTNIYEDWMQLFPSLKAYLFESPMPGQGGCPLLLHKQIVQVATSSLPHSHLFSDHLGIPSLFEA